MAKLLNLNGVSKISRECFLDNFAHKMVSTLQLFGFVQIQLDECGIKLLNFFSNIINHTFVPVNSSGSKPDFSTYPSVLSSYSLNTKKMCFVSL